MDVGHAHSGRGRVVAGAGGIHVVVDCSLVGDLVVDSMADWRIGLGMDSECLDTVVDSVTCLVAERCRVAADRAG